ncbi:conserved hypothetical protein [Altererythrobacter sp. B11]|uniref:M56 family metallopeptidase n=1 Tax=Altererythrobacter sp. B11 TaxID=2060312 RepID=UPI000DC71DF3|nr:M56 family metallopeptidase [Altererythrobacter sp. B11]BBC72473.1 conserved hypothetical protein [Altererythrobacter sp. B11]
MSAWPLEILFDTLLYTGLLIAVVLLLRRPVARHFGPQIAYSLWALPFLRLIMPPIVLPASYAPESEAMLETALAVPAAPSTGVMAGNAGAAIAATPFASGWSWSDAALQLAEQSLLPLWLAGAMVFLGWRIVSYRRMREDLLAEARPVGDVGRIRLVETPAVTAPVAFGVRDKVIALPQFFMAQRDIASRDLAIAHELAHHRGRDLLANFAAQAVLALHWFNPLAWIGWRAMRRDQEAACDARVLSGRGREDRVRYAALIANIAAGPRLALAAPMACPVLGEKSIIHRLRSLTMTETTRRQRLLGRSLVAAGALALPLTASIGYAAAAPLMPAAPVPPAPPAAPEPPAALSALQLPEPPAPPAPPVPPAVPHSAQMTTSADGKTRVWIWREKDANGETRTRRVEAHSDDGNFDEDEMQRRMDEAEAARDRAELHRDMAEAQRERAEALREAARERQQALREAGRERQQALAEAQQERNRALQEMRAEMARARYEVKQQLGEDSPVTATALRQLAVAEKAATSAAMQAMNFAFSCDGKAASRTVAASGTGAVAVNCGDSAMAVAVQGMKQARAAIAANSAIPARERAEALRDMDASLAEMSQEL